jgi:hypothetical protein
MREPKNKGEEIAITIGRDRGARYVVLHRQIINHGPQPGEVYAELELVKPSGYISFAADEIFIERRLQKTGIAFLDAGIMPQPVYGYKLRPDRELPQGNVERKFEPKSPCCKRTMRVVGSGPLRRRYCRKCDNEVPF